MGSQTGGQSGCEWDSGSLPGSVAPCERDAEEAVTCGHEPSTVQVCRRHVIATLDRVWPAPIISIETIIDGAIVRGAA